MEIHDKAQSERGRKGGEATRKLYGLAHYARAGEKGARARWGKVRAKRKKKVMK